MVQTGFAVYLSVLFPGEGPCLFEAQPCLAGRRLGSLQWEERCRKSAKRRQSLDSMEYELQPGRSSISLPTASNRRSSCHSTQSAGSSEMGESCTSTSPVATGRRPAPAFG